MADLIQASDFPELFRNKTPLLDVRAPVEFRRGAFPVAHNLPLLNDAEREAVGRRYRQHGREAAIALGHELVSAEVRTLRLEQWKSFFTSHRGAAIYCFRGGMRSSIAQSWLAETGIQVPRIAGGYKALRRCLLERIRQLSEGDKLIIVAGKTGSGKTHFINSLPNSLDLEGFARHRGSAFGRRAQTQPTQINFEHSLAIRLFDLQWDARQRVAVEDESRAIGSLSIPLDLHRRMGESPIAIIEATLEQRINTIHLDYIQSNYTDYQQHYPETADQRFADSLTEALNRIRRRLGEEAFKRISALLQDAIDQQLSSGNIDAHRQWIAELLARYYDPMYDYQLEKKRQRLVFRGTRDEIASWIQAIVAARD